MLKKLSVVTDEFSIVPEKTSEVPLRECRALIAQVAGERAWDEKLDDSFDRVARRSDLPKRIVRALYYGEITDPDSPSMVAIRKAAERFELEDLANRFEKMAHRLRSMLGASRVR